MAVLDGDLDVQCGDVLVLWHMLDGTEVARVVVTSVSRASAAGQVTTVGVSPPVLANNVDGVSVYNMNHTQVRMVAIVFSST